MASIIPVSYTHLVFRRHSYVHLTHAVDCVLVVEDICSALADVTKGLDLDSHPSARNMCSYSFLVPSHL